ncbi:methionine ABC transporter ATP-binding protein [Castellaniella daejeonensis]|uniref:Methionine ABC transporter ATP-binding protein n=1 Tax=Castellaniella daejeonensis TaxID=659013 RepID=A0ABN0T8Z1_9BURK|nr:methionine ABC transporter ATP-binding protein [Castellaniella sp.]HET8703750.1 methionine ABC transporter ATP-binding protein [Castellaniella sp.]
MIDLENIRKTYESAGRAVNALVDVNLNIREGEVFGIIGRSGAGKSTLIRMLNLLERPTEGSVRVDGRDITAFSDAQLREYRRSVGMVFQHFNLLRSRTVMDNVCFPLRLSGMPRADREARAREVLNLVGLSDQAHKYPGQLSGGQQQRVGIARALASKPRLLLCDEATSALDPETTQSILRLLGDINQRLGLTIVLITHGMDVIRAVCDRVAVIEGGRIVETGQVLEVFLHPRHDATRALLSESGLDGGEGWRTLAQGVAGRLLRLSFRGDSTATPLLSRLSRDLGLDLSILQGSVGRIKDTPYGQLVVAAEGSGAALEALAPALDAAGVDYEVLRP